VKQASKVFTNTLSFSHAIQQTKVFVALLKVREQMSTPTRANTYIWVFFKHLSQCKEPPIDCPSHQLHVHLLQQTTKKKENIIWRSKNSCNNTFSCFGQVTKWDFSTSIVITGLNLHTLIKLHFHYRNFANTDVVG
jgi:hypothetical protein